MRVELIPQLFDNYGYLVIDEETNKAAIVDAADAETVLAAVERLGVHLTTILSTHHHGDHTNGNEALLRKHPDLEVVGSKEDAERIPGLTRSVEQGDLVQVGNLVGKVLFVPCHTRGHAAYLVEVQEGQSFERALFSGDTLFAGGCGRFFEGNAAQMVQALHEVIGELPDETLVYPGHEYTLSNLRFAETLEPNNEILKEKIVSVAKARAEKRPSVPTSLGEERSYNPFLRLDSPELIQSVKKKHPEMEENPISIMAAVRSLKDAF